MLLLWKFGFFKGFWVFLRYFLGTLKRLQRRN
jgi:hypothetical protein